MMNKRRKLYLNKANKKFLGVCAGIADYLEVDALIVRLVFIISVLIGAVGVLIPAYFVLYFFLDNQSGAFKQGVTQNPVFKHFKNVDYKKRLYRNEKEGKFLGICSGIADYLEVDVTIVRVVTFALLFVAGPIPWVGYFAAYFILDKTPRFKRGESKKQDNPEQTANFSAKSDDFEPEPKQARKRREFKYCTRKFRNLHHRLAKMEAYITSSRFKLHQEFKNIS